jgi:hypothetical protein
MANRPRGLVTEFKCTSSVIFLTHPTITKELSNFKLSVFSKALGISIKEIYYKNKGNMEKIWSSDNNQNLVNDETKAMKTLQVVLNSPQQIANIEKFAKSNYSSSLSDIDGVIEGQEISKGDDVSELANVLPELSEDSVEGVKYAIPEDLENTFPKNPTYVAYRSYKIGNKKFKLIKIQVDKNTGKPYVTIEEI